MVQISRYVIYHTWS